VVSAGVDVRLAFVDPLVHGIVDDLMQPAAADSAAEHFIPGLDVAYLFVKHVTDLPPRRDLAVV
jgi:hypothetical protein